jgi:hypothetical protein
LRASCISASYRYNLDGRDSQFNQSVRVRSVVLQSSDPDKAPKTIKLVVNRPSLAFNDVEDANEKDFAQVIQLSDVDVKEGRRIPLRYVRFQSVNSLHVSCLSRSPNAQIFHHRYSRMK